MTEAEIREKVVRLVCCYDLCPGEARCKKELHTRAADAALAIAIPWAREQALREAAAVCEDYERDGQNTKAYACETADELAARILALIPYRPSQETTDE